MRRVALMLVALGVLGVAAGAAQAHEYYHHWHHGYYAPYIVSRPVVVAPRVVVPVPAPAVVYPPVYGYRYYYPAPACYAAPGFGVYYRGRGVSLGIGF